MASVGGLGRFSRGRPSGGGNDRPAPMPVSDDSNFEESNSNWMTFASSDDGANDFAFNDFGFQGVADQNFGLEDEGKLPESTNPVAGLRIFKQAIPAERRDSNGKEVEIDSKSMKDDGESLRVLPTGNMTVGRDASATQPGAERVIPCSKREDFGPQPSLASQGNVTRNDDSRQIARSATSSAGSLEGFNRDAPSVRSFSASASQRPSYAGACASGKSQETRDTSNCLNASSYPTSNWYNAQQTFLTADESTRVIPVPPSLDKRHRVIPMSNDEQAKIRPFLSPEVSDPKTPAKSAETISNPHGHCNGRHGAVPIASHSTPSACEGRRTGTNTSNIPAVTPGNDTVSGSPPSFNDGRKDACNDPQTLNVAPSKTVEVMDLDSPGKSTEYHGLNFEELHATFLSDIRDLEDLQDGNATRLLFLEGLFATTYAESLKDQANLLDLLSSLEKTSATGDEMISRFQTLY